MLRGALNAGVARREAWAWAMYDFANSGYTTVVITAVFNAYFVATVAGEAPWATLAWTAALAGSHVLVMASAPALGAYADARAAKKRLLAVATLACALGTVALGWVGPGEVGLAMLFIVVSNFWFGTGENLIAAFLPELARGRGLGRLSGLGWGLGYVGGLLCLGACLAYVARAQAAGLPAQDYVPVTLWITAATYLAASLPTFLFLRERGGEAVRPFHPGAAWGHARRHPDLARFLACIACYQAGVQAVIALAAIHAQQAMGFDTRQSIELILAVNVLAAAGALAFGPVQDRIGHKRAIAGVLVGWIATVALAWFATTPARFWWAAGLAGLCLGAAQSGGRALVGYLSPFAHRAEFFGLWGMASKLAAIFGPMSYGAVVWLTAGQHRLGILALGVYFVLGLALLAGVDVKRGRRLALRQKKRLAAGAGLG